MSVDWQYLYPQDAVDEARDTGSHYRPAHELSRGHFGSTPELFLVSQGTSAARRGGATPRQGWRERGLEEGDDGLSWSRKRQRMHEREHGDTGRPDTGAVGGVVDCKEEVILSESYLEDFDMSQLDSDVSKVEPEDVKPDLSELIPCKNSKPKADCHVCGDTAVAHMHYGGICCYSCKAFFRRAAQSGKDTTYKCFSGKGDCEVGVGNRRNCQKCRFDKCVKIGMKTSWILSDEQCQMRFRKKKPLKGKRAFAAQQRPIVSVPRSQPRLCFTKEEMKNVEFMVMMYNESKEAHSFSVENQALWERMFGPAVAAQRPDVPSSSYQYSALDFMQLINTVIKKNIFFLSANNHFQSLADEDKLALLRKNTAEICHLRGAIRFDASSNNFVWYMSEKDKLQMSYQKGSPGAKRMANMNIDQSQLSKYLTNDTSSLLFKTLGKLCSLGFPTEAYLILIFLVFFASDGLQLEDREKVENCQSIFFLLFHRFLRYLFGENVGRLKLSQAMGCLVELREVADVTKSLRMSTT